MSRDLYEALFHPAEAAMISEDAEWLALLSTAAAELRAWRADSLAEAELQDALYVDEADEGPELTAEDGPARLAAADDRELDFPVRYHAPGWRLLLGLSAEGVPYALLEQAPASADLHLAETPAPIPLAVGRPVALPGLLAPPAVLRLEAEGHAITLQPGG